MELSIAKINDYSKKRIGVSQKLMMIYYKEEVTQCSYEGYLFKTFKINFVGKGDCSSMLHRVC